jgi:hypothetical protein
MLYGLLFSCLIGRNDAFPPCCSKFHRTTLALDKILRGDLFSIDHGDGQPVSEQGAELLHQIEGQ